MMKTRFYMRINKVKISREAEADYLDLFEFAMDKILMKEIVKETELYLQQQNFVAFKLSVKYFDEIQDCMLRLYLTKFEGKSNFKTQIAKWAIVGICIEEPQLNEREEVGQVRAWLESYLL